MSSQIRGIFFDIGGVVISSPLHAISEFETAHNLPPDYINVSIKHRGSDGAWQRFERGEMELFVFYAEFGTELSDTAKGNLWYRDHCRKRGIPCPSLPDGDLKIDGRELFGRMMNDGVYDPVVVEAIRRLKETRQWTVVALTNNFSAPFDALLAADSTRAAEELAFLGWTDNGGPASNVLKAMFDDFIDSSVVGKRKPEPGFFLHACEKHGLKPAEVIFLDDLTMNLKAARELGFETIHVPIGRSQEAIQQLGEKLGTELLAPGSKL